MHYINAHYTEYKSVRISQSALDAATHREMGEIIFKSVENLGTRVVIIASGDLSHKLSASGPYGFAQEGVDFDRDIMDYLSAGDFRAILSMDNTLREKAAECGYNSFTMLGGTLFGGEFNAKLLSYECPFGVGYGVVSFNREDAFRALARRSLEYRVKTGNKLVPENTDEKFLRKAGVFVSLHKDGQLRGCIGTIAPTTASIAEEIIQNAVSAGLYDNRFPPVHESELVHLVYKVDVLDEPEDISGADELDVKKYGVIVESGHKRGLLLPNLDGVDSVEAQISIACQKAGIFPTEKFSLKRFKVTRYE
jgi:AmmeMemoRadiSam system protein A